MNDQVIYKTLVSVRNEN